MHARSQHEDDCIIAAALCFGGCLLLAGAYGLVQLIAWVLS